MKTIEALKSVGWKNVATRAAWTFVQVFLATFIVSAESLIDLLFNADWQGLMTLLVATMVGAVAAGLSAVKTVLVDVVRSVRTKIEPFEAEGVWTDKTGRSRDA